MGSGHSSSDRLRLLVSPLTLIDEEDFLIFEAVKSFHVAIRERGLLPELHQLLERAREINVAVATSPSYYTNPKAGLTNLKLQRLQLASKTGRRASLSPLGCNKIRSRGAFKPTIVKEGARSRFG
jgi:hypothetical protein